MRSRYRKILVAAGATLASMALLGSAAQAATPAPPYQDFAGCPSEAEDSGVAACAKFTFSGGHITLGKRSVPISNPFVLRGAFEQVTGAWLQNSEGGIPPVQQPVPGGLIGMTGYKWLNEFSEKALKLYATIELAGTPGSVQELPFTVPVKVHLESQLLGKTCYVGSNANPIQLALTFGTTSPPPPNKPITGKEPEEQRPEAGRPAVFVAANGIFVDNAYAVPGATGCLLEAGSKKIAIDSVVNAVYGLPAAAGTNEAVLNYSRSIVAQSTVYP
jgi:hypothetical protein